MKWTKATDFNHEQRKLYFAKRTSFSTLRDAEDTIMGTGRFNKEGHFFWEERGFVPVSKSDYHQLEILDESPPASAVEEAARMYPYHSFLRHDTTDKLRQAHITCARMYTDTIDKLKAENSKMRKALEQAKHALNNGLPRSREQEALQVINKVLDNT